jgi:deoxycytidylate deaminase
MNTHRSPKEIAEAMMSRSSCAVQVGACIEDSEGRIISWGWNSMGPSGYGIHAEAHAIFRSKRTRLRGSTLYVASNRKRSGNSVTSRPCLGCQVLLKNAGIVAFYWRTRDGDWISELT